MPNDYNLEILWKNDYGAYKGQAPLALNIWGGLFITIYYLVFPFHNRRFKFSIILSIYDYLYLHFILKPTFYKIYS